MSRQQRRSCCYRNCAVTNSEHPERTLFQFPKDEARAKRWTELGAVDTSLSGPRFMCDLHFSQIYMCFSARRKMLLNTAIPYEYGTEPSDDQQQGEEQQQHDVILGEAEIVGSTSSSQGETEEHLEGTEYEMLDTDENQMTEIIYMDDLQQLNQEDAAPPRSPAKARIIKVEKLPTLVTSSSGMAAIPTLGIPQKNIILRKVKIKKRPSSAVTSPVLAKKSKPDVEPPVETTVTSSPEKKISSPKTTKKVQTVKASSSNSVATAETPKPPQPAPAKPAKAPSIPDKPLRVTIMERRKESMNEFIFKGEEYIQLPKEGFLQDLDEADQQLQQCKAKHSAEMDELERELEACMAENEQCRTENESLTRKLEEYRMIIKNMKDVLGMFEAEED